MLELLLFVYRLYICDFVCENIVKSSIWIPIMDFQFEIPRNNKELLGNANGSNYFVVQVYNAAELPTLIRGNYD